MITGVEHIAIYSKNTAALKDWYIKILNFSLVCDFGNGTFFIKAPGGFMIELITEKEHVEVLGNQASGFRHLALLVDDFNKTVNELTKENVVVVSEPSVSPSGVSTFFFRDPDGNILHLVSRVNPL